MKRYHDIVGDGGSRVLEQVAERDVVADARQHRAVPLDDELQRGRDAEAGVIELDDVSVVLQQVESAHAPRDVVGIAEQLRDVGLDEDAEPAPSDREPSAAAT